MLLFPGKYDLTDIIATAANNSNQKPLRHVLKPSDSLVLINITVYAFLYSLLLHFTLQNIDLVMMVMCILFHILK